MSIVQEFGDGAHLIDLFTPLAYSRQHPGVLCPFDAKYAQCEKCGALTLEGDGHFIEHLEAKP